MASRFTRNPTPRYRAALKALRDLVDEEGLDMTTRAFAEATTAAHYNVFVEGSHMVETHHHACPHRLVGMRCPSYRRDHEDECLLNRMPGIDHLSSWRHEGKRGLAALVSQPYSLGYETLKEIVAFCERYALRADVSATLSWHFPSQTLRVVYRPASEDRDRLSLYSGLDE